jgi:hypothetical protein
MRSVLMFMALLMALAQEDYEQSKRFVYEFFKKISKTNLNRLLSAYIFLLFSRHQDCFQGWPSTLLVMSCRCLWRTLKT